MWLLPLPKTFISCILLSSNEWPLFFWCRWIVDFCLDELALSCWAVHLENRCFLFSGVQVCAFTAAADLIRRWPSSVPQRCRALISVCDALVSIWFTIWLLNVTNPGLSVALRMKCCVTCSCWYRKDNLLRAFCFKMSQNTKCDTLICSCYVMWHVDGVIFFFCSIKYVTFYGRQYIKAMHIGVSTRVEVNVVIRQC